MARTNSNAGPLSASKQTASKETASKQTASKPAAKLSVRPRKPRAKVSHPQIKAAKAPKDTESVDNAGTLSSAKRQAVELGDSVVTWGKAHPFQAALAAAAVVAGVAALVSFARHRRALTTHTSNDTARGTMHFNVEDLVTSHVTTPHIPSHGRGRPFTRPMTPTLERTIASNHFGQPGMT